MLPASPRFLYLHGFASSPRSAKASAFADHYGRRGVHIERLDLRQPSMEHLRLSAMMATTRAAIGGDRDRAVLVGSSLGGLTAARVAEEDARVFALVLMAPALRFIERWPRRLGEAAWTAWRDSGWLEIFDYGEECTGRVDFGLVEDVAVIDARGDGWPDVRVPTLVVHGRSDEVVDIALSRQWARDRRKVELVEVDDGHELTRSLPRILAASDEFLRPILG